MSTDPPTFPPELETLMRRLAIARHQRAEIMRELDRVDTLATDAGHEVELREHDLQAYLMAHVSQIDAASAIEAADTYTAAVGAAVEEARR